MTVDEFAIKLDDPYKTYLPGQMVSGKLVLRISGKEKAKAIRLSFDGKVHVGIWAMDYEGGYRYEDSFPRGHSALSIRQFFGKENLFSFEEFLMGDGNDKIIIPPGPHIFPFAFQFPIESLPCSYQHDFGSVEYAMEANILRGWLGGPDEETRVVISFSSVVDLNLSPELAQPATKSRTEEFCCCCCANGPLTINVMSPKQGYVPGEVIQLVVEVNNRSNRKVTHFISKLIQNCSFLADEGLVGQVKAEYHSDDLVIENYTVDQPVSKGDSKTHRLELVIPPAPPTDLGCYLKIIHVSYACEVGVTADENDVTVEIPITIGTVPFQTQSSSGLSSTTTSIV